MICPGNSLILLFIGIIICDLIQTETISTEDVFYRVTWHISTQDKYEHTHYEKCGQGQ